MAKVVKLKLQYFGHVARGSAGQLALTFLEGSMEGTRYQGKPRWQWLNDIEDWTEYKYIQLKEMSVNSNGKRRHGNGQLLSPTLGGGRPTREREKCWTALRTHKSEQVQLFKHKTLRFHFSTYCPNSCKHLSHHTPVWLHKGMDRCDRQNKMATRFFLINNTFQLWANYLHQTRIAGLVKYLSLYTGHISDWMAFALSHFAHSKRITEGCSLWDDFNGNVVSCSLIVGTNKSSHRRLLALH